MSYIWKKYLNIDAIANIIFKDACEFKNNHEYDKAIEYFNAVQEVAPKYQEKCTEKIYYCIKYKGDIETAYNYAMEHDVYLTRNETKEILQDLKKYDDLIELLQTAYTKEEKDEKPSLYAELADAFIAIGKVDIALQVLSSGPISKRKMDNEMCIYRYALANCFELLGKEKDAQKQYSKIYAYDASFKDVALKV